MEYYLATTGISKIWKLDSKLLVLGPWCLVDSGNKNLVRGKEYVSIPSPWENGFNIKEAADYCYKIYEELLPQLSENLNFIHQINCPIKYWRILLGYWLLHFIGIFYDRYKRIENVYNLFPNFYTHVLSLRQSKEDIAAIDTYNFFNAQLNDDYYNLKLFSVICEELYPKNIIEKEIDHKSKTLVFKYSLKRKLFYNLISLFNKFSKNSIVLSEMYDLSPLDMLMLKTKLGFKSLNFIDFVPASEKILNDNYLPNLRETLTLKGGNDRFQSLLYKYILKAIPKCYLENFKFYRKSIGNGYSIKAIGSSIGWYLNERFKFFAAESVLQGAKTIDFLHGGGYGYLLSVPHETISMEKDIFYSWGWKGNNRGKFSYLPSARLSKMKDSYSYSINKILFIGYSALRYPVRFLTGLQPDDMEKYFNDKKKFFLGLSPKLTKNILYRPFFNQPCLAEQRPDEIQKVKEICPDIKFLLDTPLIEWMKKVKLIVIDCPFTSFLEALVINAPCVFYWDHNVYLMRKEAEEYFEMLRKSGILYNDPISAAEKVNEIFDNPLDWWLNRDVQNARIRFCEHFSYARQDWMKIWIEEFRQIITEFHN